MIDIKRNPSPGDLKRFAAIWTPIFAGLLGGVVIQRSGSWRVAVSIWAAALFVAVLGLVRPRLVRPIFITMQTIGYPIGFVVSNLILAAMYFLVFAPIGFMLRRLGRDPLDRQPDRNATTYWIVHAPRSDPASYFKQF